jgi:NAD(P)-dependent dehydrogenase (short-subunit alcohol dehydrogenase family)
MYMTARVAVITGGASGIGRATCLKFAAKGDKVVVSDFNEEMGRIPLIR